MADALARRVGKGSARSAGFMGGKVFQNRSNPPGAPSPMGGANAAATAAANATQGGPQVQAQPVAPVKGVAGSPLNPVVRRFY
jgi:hypothetical protein